MPSPIPGRPTESGRVRVADVTDDGGEWGGEKVPCDSMDESGGVA